MFPADLQRQPYFIHDVDGLRIDACALEIGHGSRHLMIGGASKEEHIGDVVEGLRILSFFVVQLSCPEKHPCQHSLLILSNLWRKVDRMCELDFPPHLRAAL